jgi:fumarate reductase subunit D
MRLIHRLEPVFWILFAAGGAAAAMLFPALLLGLTIAGPLGWTREGAMDYHRMYGIVSNPLSRVILFAVVSMVLWHAAHHLRHLFLDLGLGSIEGAVCTVVYGMAGVGTLWALSTAITL